MNLALTAQGYALVVAGAVLFLIGLIQGVLIPAHRNSRMALSAHLTAVQCGMALMIFGVVWQFVELDALWSQIAMWSFIASVYLIWLGITVAGVSGASRTLPIAGEGYSAGRLAEQTVTAIMGCGVALSLLSGVLAVAGLLRFSGF